MKVEFDRPKVIYVRAFENMKAHSIQHWKKDEDGNFTCGFIPCRFPKNAKIKNKDIVKIEQARLDFYLKDGKTFTFVFISKFEVIGNKEQDVLPKNIKSKYSSKSQIQLTFEDYPF